MTRKNGSRRSHNLSLAVACASAWLALPVLPTLAQDLTVNDAQVERGLAIYEASCTSCHGAGLNGANAPELHGGLFVIHWAGKPASELFTFIKENMPAGAPGSLYSDDYRDVLAAIFKANGYPSSADAPEIDKTTDLAAVTVEDRSK